MKSIILISSYPLNLRDLEDRYGIIGITDTQSDQRLVVERRKEWFAINLDCDNESDFEKSELEYIRQFFDCLHFSLLEYSSNDVANFAILELIYQGSVLVDNDHGLILPIDDVRRRIERGEDWLMT